MAAFGAFVAGRDKTDEVIVNILSKGFFTPASVVEFLFPVSWCIFFFFLVWIFFGIYEHSNNAQIHTNVIGQNSTEVQKTQNTLNQQTNKPSCIIIHITYHNS